MPPELCRAKPDAVQGSESEADRLRKGAKHLSLLRQQKVLRLLYHTSPEKALLFPEIPSRLPVLSLFPGGYTDRERR